MTMSLHEVAEALEGEALSFPGAWADHPWGDSVVKVGKKIFVFFGTPDDGGFGLSVKLPESADEALTLPGAEPTGYGLGKAGWVSLRYQAGDDVPVDLLRDWIDESYRAVATKTLIKQLEAQRAEESS